MSSFASPDAYDDFMGRYSRQLAPAESLPWPEQHFDAALTQLVVTSVSDAPAGVREMRRVVRDGGTVAVCIWDRQGMEMLAAVERAQARCRAAAERSSRRRAIALARARVALRRRLR